MNGTPSADTPPPPRAPAANRSHGLTGAAFFVGATLGSSEALWVLAQLRGADPIEITALLVCGCLGYGAVSAAAAVGVTLARRGRPAHGPQVTIIPDAIGIAVAAVSAVHFVRALVRLGQPRLAWLLPGCILSGIAIGIAARWFSLRVPSLRRSATWARGSVALLFAGVLLGGVTGDRGALVWYAAAGGVLLAAAAAMRVWRRRTLRPQPSPMVNLVSLLVAIALLPGAVSAVGKLRSVPVRSARTPPNILLISVDTLRSDRLGCYGSARAQTPQIDSLAREGALFEEASSPIPLTGPSHTTMLTGLYPVHHGARNNGIPIRDDVVTVPEILSYAGYETAAFVSGWTLKDAATALARRFDHYDEDFTSWPALPDALLRLALPALVAHTCSAVGHKIEPLQRIGARTTARALAWLARHRDRPLFAFVHYFDPHGPHAPPQPSDGAGDTDDDDDLRHFGDMQPLAVRQRIVSNPHDLERIAGYYDAEIAYTDAEVGRLLSGLADLGLAENTLVIFTADHGESLTEHDFYFDHGEYLYDTCVHIPLIVRFADRRYAGTRWPGQVRLVDLAPTMLEIAGRMAAGPLDGRSLLPVLQGTEPPHGRAGLGAIELGEGEAARARYYVRQDGYKLIWNFDRREALGGRPALEEVYNLTVDPGELQNLAPHAPPPLDALRRRLQVWAQEKAPAPRRVGESVREQLRLLGYR
jgi:arylsulfatase A-like enzyme